MRYTNQATKEQRPNLVYPIKNPFTGKEIEHPINAWKYSKEEHERHTREKRLWWGKNGEYQYPRLKVYLSELEGIVSIDVWDQEVACRNNNQGSSYLDNFFTEKIFQNPKPVKLIEKILKMIYNNFEGKDFFILDFFAGSGTTANGVLNVNDEDGGTRKYILIESANYVETVIKPRIQKRMFSNEWKDGTPLNHKGSFHIFKYIHLEQYEDTLTNIVLSPDDGNQEVLDRFEDYFIKYMLLYESKKNSPCLNLDRFNSPLGHSLKINGITTPIDLIESFNYLLGLTVENIIVTHNKNDKDREYRIVMGYRENEKIAIFWRNINNMDYFKDRDFINEFLKDEKLDTIYLNGGDSLIDNAVSLETKFLSLLSYEHD